MVIKLGVVLECMCVCECVSPGKREGQRKLEFSHLCAVLRKNAAGENKSKKNVANIAKY